MIQRVVWLVLLVGAAYFALQGGEYSTRGIVTLRARRADLQSNIDSLQRTVDSLVRVERTVRLDPATQERIAREEFGMVRGDNEILYRFVAPDSVARATPSD